jgi:hypothetical protein
VLAVAAVVAVSCGGHARVAVKHRPAAPRQATSTKPAVDPYKASLAFARCMRGHGVAHPDPDVNGDFSLTLKQEERMRASATPAQHEAAEKACFHFLKPVVSTKPLSSHALSLAKQALHGFARCMAGRGYDWYRSPPVAGNLSRGRAFFGFRRSDPRADRALRRHDPRFLRNRTACEHLMNVKLDAIIKTDRGVPQY